MVSQCGNQGTLPFCISHRKGEQNRTRRPINEPKLTCTFMRQPRLRLRLQYTRSDCPCNLHAPSLRRSNRWHHSRPRASIQPWYSRLALEHYHFSAKHIRKLEERLVPGRAGRSSNEPDLAGRGRQSVRGVLQALRMGKCCGKSEARRVACQRLKRSHQDLATSGRSQKIGPPVTFEKI